MAVNLGLTLSNRGVATGGTTVESMLDLARRADADRRWDGVWVGDSLLAKPRLDALTLMAAVAGVTSRVRIGAACFASTPLRPALLLAHQWASLDRLAGGRTVFSACMGAPPAHDDDPVAREYDAFCIAPASRIARMEEAIEVMRLLTRGERASYDGEYVSFKDVLIEPKSARQPVKILVTSNPRPDQPRNRERGLRRVARLGDGWMTTFQRPEIVAEYLAEIKRYAAEEGRELGDDFEVAVYHNVNLNDDRAAALAEAKRYLDEYYMTDYAPAAVEAWVALGGADECVAKIREYEAAGATTVMLRFAADDQEAQYERFAAEVLPAFED